MNSDSFSSSKPRGGIQLQRQKFSKYMYYTSDHLSAEQNDSQENCHFFTATL